MVECEHGILFEAAIQDGYAVGMLEANAIGRWMACYGDIKKILAERPSLSDLYAQMKKDQMVNTALIISKKAKGLSIWCDDDTGKGSHVIPSVSALRAMKKDALAVRLMSAYKRAMSLLVLRLDLDSLVVLLSMASRDDAALIGMTLEAEAGKPVPKEKLILRHNMGN